MAVAVSIAIASVLTTPVAAHDPAGTFVAEEVGDDLLFGASEASSCFIEVASMGSGSCTTTWTMSGPISYQLWVGSFDLAGVADVTASWSDSGGVAYAYSCTNRVMVNNAVAPSQSCTTTANRAFYFAGPQSLTVTVTGLVCASTADHCTARGTFFRW